MRPLQIIRNYNATSLAEQTEGLNYADLRSIVESAVKGRATELIRSNKAGIVKAPYITGVRLEKQVKEQQDKFGHKEKARLGF